MEFCIQEESNLQCCASPQRLDACSPNQTTGRRRATPTIDAYDKEMVLAAISAFSVVPTLSDDRLIIAAHLQRRGIRIHPQMRTENA